MIRRHYVTPSRGIALKFQGIIDLPELYKQMKMWLEDKGYAKANTVEKSYVEKVKPNGKQIEISWEGEKSISDYFKYKIKVLFVLIGVNETEVQEEGVKRKLYKGNFQIYISAYVEEGGDLWDSLGPLTKLYHNLVAKKRLQDCKSDLYDAMYSFQNFIRKFLEVRT